MSDHELLELAAKAAGIDVDWYASSNEEIAGHGSYYRKEGVRSFQWNPLKDDGDALRLAVLLSLRVEPYTGVKMDEQRALVANITDVYSLHSAAIRLSEPHNLDPGAATRRAIVRASPVELEEYRVAAVRVRNRRI